MIARDQIGILVVEPSETYQRILGALLRKLTFTNIIQVKNAPRAHLMLKHNKSIRVVISELMMPEPEGGMRLVREIRENFSPQELPILMLTALAEKDLVTRAVDAGVNGYLIKPIDPELLEAQLLPLFHLPLRGSHKLGEFLVRNNLVTPEQRDLALQYQKDYSSEFHSLAQLSLYLGYVSERKIMATVFKHQLDDNGFLQWAGSLGMKQEEIDHVQEIKKRFRLRIGDTLVKLGFLSEKDLQESLRQSERQKMKQTVPPMP